jgi:tetratricopeptide (TPR) repeat protein
MRILVCVLVLVFTLSASAQSASVKQLFGEAAGLASAGKFASALGKYQLVLEKSKGESISPTLRARVHYNLGVCEYRLGRPERAVGELETAIELRGGDYPQAFYALGMAEAARADWPKARAAFVRVLASDNRNAEAWFDLAFAHIGERNFESAELAFRNAIANGSVDSPFGHNNIGVILAARGDIAGAKKEFETAYRTSNRQLKIAFDNLRWCESLGTIGETGLLAWSRNTLSLKRGDESL